MELPIFNTYMNFPRHQFYYFTVVPLFVLDKSMAWNRCLQHPCFKTLCRIDEASKNSDSNAQHFLSDLLTHSWFHSMLFALPRYQFPSNVMNRCLYLTVLGLSSFSTPSLVRATSHTGQEPWPWKIESPKESVWFTGRPNTPPTSCSVVTDPQV
jgi:hypothetical protein